MYRKDLAEFLLDNPTPLSELARQLGVPVRELAEDVAHLQKSLRHTDRRVAVVPARCRKCDFVFSGEKLTRPGHCPRCKGTWIHEPRVAVRSR